MHADMHVIYRSRSVRMKRKKESQYGPTQINAQLNKLFPGK